MRTRTRRRAGNAAVAGGSLAVGALALVGGFVGNPESVERYWTAAEVREDGSARVTEAIDYDFGNLAQDRHGIFRWIPGLTTQDDVTVSSPDAPAGTDLTPQAQTAIDGTRVDGLNIRIGDPDQTVSGRRRYDIAYDLPGVRRGDVVDWEAVGTGWDVGMDEVEIHLLTPFELDDVVCTHGAVRSTTPCDATTVEPGHVTVSLDGLGVHEGVSIEGRVGAALAAAPAAPAAPTDRPEEPGTGLLPPAGLAAAGALAAAVPATVLVRRAGRERVGAGGPADAAYYTDTGAGTGGASPTAPGAVPPPPPVPGSSLAHAGADAGPLGWVLPGAPDAGQAAPSEVSATAPGVTLAPGGVAGGSVASGSEGGGTSGGSDGESVVRVDADELAQMATIEFAPPAGVSPAHGGIVLQEEVRHEHKVAWLVQAAIDGAIDIEDDGDRGGRGARLRRLPEGVATDEQQLVLDQMFRDAPFGSELELGSYDRGFATGWATLGHRLESWRETSGLWDARADGRRLAARVLGILGAVVGVVAAAGGGALAANRGAGWLWLAAAGGLLAGAGLATALRAWELHVRTPAGSAVWLRVESFRRFLAESEAYHAEEAARRGVLREYTAWAIAVGEIDRWSRAVQAASIPPTVAGMSYVYMGPLLLASTTSTATAPSSSGGGGGGFSGGFGGGSVGGGAGGGGGGSW